MGSLLYVLILWAQVGSRVGWGTFDSLSFFWQLAKSPICIGEIFPWHDSLYRAVILNSLFPMILLDPCDSKHIVTAERIFAILSTVPCEKIEPLFFLDYSADMYSRKTTLTKPREVK